MAISLIAVTVFFYACQKDVALDKGEIIEEDIILIQRGIDDQGLTLMSPSSEVLNDVRDMLFQQTWFTEHYEEMSAHYGNLRWNYTILNQAANDVYTISIPMVKQNRINALLIVIGHVDHYEFIFHSRDHLINQYQEEPNMSSVEIFALRQINSLEIIRNGRMYSSLKLILDSQVDDSNTVVTRNTYLDYTTVDSEITEDFIENISVKHYSLIIPCGGSGSGGGNANGWTPGGPHTGGTTSSTDNDDYDNLSNVLDRVSECDNYVLSTEAKMLILEEYSGLIDPCDPDKSVEDLLADALADICTRKLEEAQEGANTGVTDVNFANTIISADELRQVIEQNDYVRVIDKSSCEKDNLSMEKDCPKLKKALDAIIGSDSGNPNCDLLAFIGETENSTTSFIWDCNDASIVGGNDGTIPTAQTSYGGTDQINGQDIKVYFSSSICDSSCMKIMSVILHESIHAELIARAFDDLDDNGIEIDPSKGLVIDLALFEGVLRDLKEEIYPTTLSHDHQIIANYYAEQYSVAMWKLTGMIGDSLDYMYWAYDGLNVNAFNTLGTPLLPDSMWQEHISNWNEISDSIPSNFCEN